MFDVRSWSSRVKKKGESEEELDTGTNIDQFLATATLNEKGKTPQRWSTIPSSRARGATQRVSHNLPPQQAFLINQIADPPIHRSTESPPRPSATLPSLSPQLPIRRVPVPTRITQYLAEAPGPDIIGRNIGETNPSSVRESPSFYHQLDAVQHPNNPSEVEQSPAEPDEFAIEGRTYQFPFSSHDLVAKPHIEVEGDRPNIDEVVPFCTTDQSFDPSAPYQSNPVELSADPPSAGEPILRADSSLSPEVGSGFDANSTSGAETILTEKPNNMNPPSTALARNNEYPWILQGHNSRVPVSQTQFRHNINNQQFDPTQADQSVQKAQDQQPLATIQTDQPAGNHNNSAARPKLMSNRIRGDGDRASTIQTAAPHHHDHQSVLAKIHNQSVPHSSNPRDRDKHKPGPPAQGHGIINLPVHQSDQPLTDSIETKGIPAAREEEARQHSLQLVEGNSPMSSLGHAYHEPGRVVDPSSVNDITVTQRSSELRLSPKVEPAITRTRTAAPNPLQQIANLPGSGHPNPDDTQLQARRSMPQTATPEPHSSHTAAPDTGERRHFGNSKSTQESGSRHIRNVLEKQQPVPNHPSKENFEGSKNRGLGVMKKLVGLVGGSGSTMPVSYSPEELTRRCLDFMEQQNIPSNAGIDPFSSILVYALGKWRGDEAQIHEQSIEIKNLMERKERYRSQLESTQEQLRLMTLQRDQLRRDLIGTDGKLKAIEKDLRACQGSLRKQEQENQELEKWALEVEATNEEVFKEGEWRIHELKETISRTVREKDREFRNIKAEKEREFQNMKGEKEREFQNMKATCEKEITRLQKRIASYGIEGFRFISDDKFQGKMQAAVQTINNLVTYIDRPAPDKFDANLDGTFFLRRNEPYLGTRLWPKFIFGVCWGILKRGFFSAPLGFGILGAEGDGYDSLNRIRETLAIYDPTTKKLEISNNKRTNEVRGFLFERLLADVTATATPYSAYSVTREKGVKGLPIYFHRHVDKVTNELVSVLTRCSAENLSPLALPLIQELVRDVGFLALEMATQRAHVTLEFCVHGDVIQQGKYFKDEASGDGVVGVARVDLMIEPALTRLGNGKDDLKEEEVLRKGSFVALGG